MSVDAAIVCTLTLRAERRIMLPSSLPAVGAETVSLVSFS